MCLSQSRQVGVLLISWKRILCSSASARTRWNPLFIHCSIKTCIRSCCQNYRLYFLEMNAQRSSDKGVLDEIWSAVEFLDSQKETKEDHSASQALGVHSRDGMLLASAVAVCAKMKHRSM
jgi:hypothetical protein